MLMLFISRAWAREKYFFGRESESSWEDDVVLPNTFHFIVLRESSLFSRMRHADVYTSQRERERKSGSTKHKRGKSWKKLFNVESFRAFHFPLPNVPSLGKFCLNKTKKKVGNFVWNHISESLWGFSGLKHSNLLPAVFSVVSRLFAYISFFCKNAYTKFYYTNNSCLCSKMKWNFISI